MARCMKRLTAMCLAVTLLLGQLVLPAGAATENYVDENGNQVTQTEQTTTTPTSTTVETQKITESPDGTKVTVEVSTETKTEQTAGNVTQQEHQEHYEKTETEYGVQPDGTQYAQQTITGNATQESSTTTEGETSESEKELNKGQQTVVTEKEEMSEEDYEPQDPSTSESTTSEEGDWVKRDEEVLSVTDNKDQQTSSDKENVGLDLTDTTLEFNDTIVVDGNGDASQSVSASVSLTVTPENIQSGEYNLEELAQNPNVTITENRDENGNIVSWTVETRKQGTTSSESTALTPDEQAALEAGRTGADEKADVTTPLQNVENSEYEQKAAAAPVTTTEDDGSTTTVAVEKKTESDGSVYYEQTTTKVTTIPGNGEILDLTDTMTDAEKQPTITTSSHYQYVTPPKPAFESHTQSDGSYIEYTVTLMDGNDNGTPYQYWKVAWNITGGDPNSTYRRSGSRNYSGKTTTVYTEPAVPAPADYTDSEGQRYTYTVTPKTQTGGMMSGRMYYEVSYTVTGPDGQVIGGGVEEIYGTTSQMYQEIITEPESKTMEVSKTTITEVLTEKVTFQETSTTSFSDTDAEGDKSKQDKETTTTPITEDTYTIDSTQIIYDANGNPMVTINGRLYAIVDESVLRDDISVNDMKIQSPRPYDTSEWSLISSTTGGYDVVGLDANGNLETHGVGGMIVVQGGIKRMVYCIELDQSTQSIDGPMAYQYADVLYRDDAINDDAADWGGSIYQLRSIGLNGYFEGGYDVINEAGKVSHVDAGQGSLSAVKNLLYNNKDLIETLNLDDQLTDEMIENLSAKQAVTATQAALWQYGSPNEVTIGYNCCTDPTVRILRALLVHLAEEDADNYDQAGNYQGAAQAITGESVTGISLTLKDRATDADGNLKTVTNTATNETHNVYNAEVAFKLDVSRSSINGDLIVKVLDDQDNMMKYYRLSDDKSQNSVFDGLEAALLGSIRPQADGSYVLEGLELAENLKFSIRLEGTQHLDEGMIIYENPDVQDLISAAYIDNHVNIEFAMDFSVNADAQATTLDYQQTKVANAVYDKYDTETTTSTTKTVTFLDGHTETAKTGNVKVTARVYTTEKKLDKNISKYRWEMYYEYLMATTFGFDGGIFELDAPGGNPGGAANPNAVVIPDEQVPLAVAPATGDVSYIWAAVSVLSLAAYFILNRKPKMV